MLNDKSKLTEPRNILDKMLGDEDAVSGGWPHGVVAEPKYQPINQATHECLRGPCRHLWKMTARFGDANIGDRIQLKHVSQCNAHYEPTELAEENIYHCSLWWPATLSWVPLSIQAILRPQLRHLWAAWLKFVGYDFSWKHWPDDIFEADSKVRRKNSSPGAPSGITEKSDGSIEFNS